MFKFNELSILDDKITMDIQIEDDEKYKDLWIDSITVSNQTDFIERSSKGKKDLYRVGDHMFSDSEFKGEDVYKTEYEFSSWDSTKETNYAVGKVKYISKEHIEDDLYWYTVEVLENKDPQTGEDIVPEEIDWRGKTVQLYVNEDNLWIDGQIFPLFYNGESTNIWIEVKNKIEYYRHIRLVLDKNMFNDLTKYNLKDLLFMYVNANGDYDQICDEKVYIIHPVVDMLPFYCRGMNYVKTLGDTCNIPREFIDYILMYKAFELSLYTGNYINAISYYNKFNKFNNSGIQVKSRRGGGCGCH